MAKKTIKNIIIYVISPIHVISSLSAVKSRHGDEPISISIIVHWPGVASQIAEELGRVVKNITRNFSLIESINVVPQSDLDKILSLPDPGKSIDNLKGIVGNIDVHEIYYAHDVVGRLYQAFCAAYPKARRICFGDGMGNVYEKEVHLSYLFPQEEKQISAGNRIKEKIRQILCPNNHPGTSDKSYRPHEAALILPVDQSGHFLKNIPLTIPQKDTVLDLLNKCVISADDLQGYIKDLMNKFRGRNKYLLLTDNFAEGNFIDFDREIEMWRWIIETHCKPGGVVFIKSHPGETLPRNENIKECLKEKYEVYELKEEFKRYPIEFWKELLQSSTVICMSYPVLSLKYLYNINVIQPMDDAFVERWFPEWTWRSYKNSIELYMVPHKRLDAWDGKSLLYP